MKNEKMYDFGQLGKWSKATLDAQTELIYDAGYECDRKQVPAIEKLYSAKSGKIYEEKTDVGTDPVKYFKNVSELYGALKRFGSLKKSDEKLDKDYEKYEKTIGKV